MDGPRSIPACAGEPAGHAGCAGHAGVYPRVCGGTADRGSQVRYSYGLSPRVRGNHCVMMPDDARLRSIPACAGEPAA